MPETLATISSNHHRLPPILKPTKDENQYVAKTKDVNVLRRWQKALQIRYVHLFKEFGPFHVIWKDVTFDKKELALKDLRSGTLPNNLALSFVQIWSEGDIFITVTVYFKLNRSKGGSCLVQGLKSTKWAQTEYRQIVEMVERLENQEMHDDGLVTSSLNLPTITHSDSNSPQPKTPSSPTCLSSSTDHMGGRALVSDIFAIMDTPSPPASPVMQRGVDPDEPCLGNTLAEDCDVTPMVSSGHESIEKCDPSQIEPLDAEPTSESTTLTDTHAVNDTTLEDVLTSQVITLTESPEVTFEGNPTSQVMTSLKSPVLCTQADNTHSQLLISGDCDSKPTIINDLQSQLSTALAAVYSLQQEVDKLKTESQWSFDVLDSQN